MTSPKSSSLKLLVLLALGLAALAAFASPASAQNIAWSAAGAAPKIPTGKTNGFYIWHIGTEVYMTTTGNSKTGHDFRGLITVTGAKGKITGLVGKKLEKQDSFSQLSTTQVQFLFVTHNGTDSLHFKLTAGTQLAFLATYDLGQFTNLINYGKKPTPANQNPAIFDLTK
jgi:hypothetical protein